MNEWLIKNILGWWITVIPLITGSSGINLIGPAFNHRPVTSVYWPSPPNNAHSKIEINFPHLWFFVVVENRAYSFYLHFCSFSLQFLSFSAPKAWILIWVKKGLYYFMQIWCIKKECILPKFRHRWICQRKGIRQRHNGSGWKLLRVFYYLLRALKGFVFRALNSLKTLR